MGQTHDINTHNTHTTSMVRHLYSKLPLTADFYTGNWSKVIWRHQSALFGTADTCHALQRQTDTEICVHNAYI